MRGKLFLVHWNSVEAEELAGPLRSAQWEVSIESEDGARAGNRAKESPPDAVVIFLSRLPSHGRETARYLRSTKATRDVPIVFVEGKGDPLAKTKAMFPDAAFTAAASLLDVVSKFAGRS